MLLVLDTERDVLAGTDKYHPHALDERVFNRLAEQTDLRNGQIGFNSELSMAYIASALSENMARKAKGNREVVSRKQVENAIGRLVNAGLLERHSEGRRMRFIRVFWCEFLRVIKSVQNPVGTSDGTAVGTLISADVKILSYIFNGLHSIDRKNTVPVGTSDGTAVGTSSIHTYIHTPAANKFAMNTSWKPDEKLLASYLGLSMCKPEQIENEWFAEFVLFWCGKPEVLRTSDEWVRRYVRDMVHYIGNPQLFNDRHGIGEVRKKGSKSGGVTNVSQLIPMVPRSDTQWKAYADRYGLPQAKPGQDIWQWKQSLENAREKLINKSGGG